MSILEQSTSLYGQQFKKTVTDNFQYEGINWGFGYPGNIKVGQNFLGYYEMDGDNYANYIELNIYIPSNFTITSATITFIHTPVNWDDGGTYDVWGYCRNIKAYKVSNISNLLVTAAFMSEYDVSTVSSTEIYGAFGDSGYIALTPSDSSHITETTISSDISAQLTTGNNVILIKTSDSIPTYNANPATNAANCGVKTGYARAIANVFGYYS